MNAVLKWLGAVYVCSVTNSCAVETIALVMVYSGVY